MFCQKWLFLFFLSSYRDHILRMTKWDLFGQNNLERKTIFSMIFEESCQIIAIKQRNVSRESKHLECYIFFTLMTSSVICCSWLEGGPSIWAGDACLCEILAIISSVGTNFTLTACWVWVYTEVTSPTSWIQRYFYTICCLAFNKLVYIVTTIFVLIWIIFVEKITYVY